MNFEYKEKEMNGGVQRLYKFDNGYGASVIRHNGSYGSDKGLWELAVVHFNDPIHFDGVGYLLCYDTPITDDVIGYLNDDEVKELLFRINDLPVSE